MKGSLAVLAAVLVLAVSRATVLAPAPRTGVWSVVSTLARPRAYATAIPLLDGKILVLGGGLDPKDPQVTDPTSELIDPATGKVTTLASKLPGRLHQTATIGWHGHVVVAGGVEWIDGHFESTDRVDVFDPQSNTWSAAARLRDPRSDHGAAALPDGRVLVTGGNWNTRPLASTEIYDPQTDTWRWGAPLSRPRVRFSIASLPDGRVMVAGGLDEKGHPVATTEIYDPAEDRWTVGPDMSVPRVQHAMVQLANGDLLFIGGQDAASGTAERYDHVTGRFVYAGTLATPRLVEQAAVLPDGRVLITGGSEEKPDRQDWVPFASAEVWDPHANMWSVFPSPKLPRALGMLIPTTHGVFLISGIGDDQAPHQSIERLTLK